MIAVRVACINATWRSNARTPRTLADISEPTATITTATSASATSTSMMVKPASRRSVDGGAAENNFHPPCQPVNATFETCIEARQCDRAAARGAVGEKANGRKRGAPLAGLGQYRIEVNVVGNADRRRRRPGADRAAAGI